MYIVKPGVERETECSDPYIFLSKIYNLPNSTSCKNARMGWAPMNVIIIRTKLKI